MERWTIRICQFIGAALMAFGLVRWNEAAMMLACIPYAVAMTVMVTAAAQGR